MDRTEVAPDKNELTVQDILEKSQTAAADGTESLMARLQPNFSDAIVGALGEPERNSNAIQPMR